MLTLDQKNFIYNFIDAVYVINLPTRKDRMENVIKELTKVGLVGKMEVIGGIRFDDLHYTSGRAGCSAAHTKALTTAYDRQVRNVLVLEDDVFFVEEKLQTIYDAIFDLDRINWDICYFGARIKDKMDNFSNGLYRISNFGCGTAILYNYKVLEYILGLLPKYHEGYDKWMEFVNQNECLDVWLPRIVGQNADFFVFSSRELVALQTAGFSDINNKICDGIKIMNEDFERYK